jgi:DNA-binding transcriptional LysR family regulator
MRDNRQRVLLEATSSGLRQLKNFVTVAHCGSTTAAAKKLYVAQPAVSAHIKRLEADLGVELFERTPHGMELTAAGAALLPRAEAVLREFAGMFDEARRRSGERQRTLQIGYDRHGAGSLMQRILSTFAELHDDVKVTLRHEMRRGTMLGLEDDTTDLAIFLGPRDIGSDYTVVTLFEDPVMAVVSSAHELARGSAVDIRDVVRYPFSNYPDYADSGSERALRAFWLALEHRGDAEAAIAHQAVSTDDWLQSIRFGDGVSLATRSISRYYAQPGLTFVPVTGMAAVVCGLIWPRRRTTTLVEAFASIAASAASSFLGGRTELPLRTFGASGLVPNVAEGALVSRAGFDGGFETGTTSWRTGWPLTHDSSKEVHR